MTLEFNWVDFAAFGVLNLLFIYVLFAIEIRQLHKVYIFFHFAMMLWPFGQFSLSMTDEPLYHRIYLNLSFIGIAMLCFGWLLFSIMLTRGNGTINPARALLLALPAVAAGAIVLTDPIHGKFAAPIGGLLTDRSYGPFFWYFAACCMLYIISGALIMLLALRRSEAYTYRRQVIFFIAGLTLLLGCAALDTAINAKQWLPELEGTRGLTSLGIVASGFCFVFAMRKHNVFQVVSLALREVVDSMETGIVILDQHHVVLDHNASGRRYCPVPIGRSFPIMSLMEGAIEPQFGRKFLHSYFHEKGKFLQTEIMIWDEKRNPIHVTMRITPVYNESGIYIGRIVTFQDVTEWRHLVRELHDRNEVLVHRNHDLTLIQHELSEANRKLELLATTDPLTGCYNRRYLFQMLEHQLAVEHRYRVPFSIILFDVDHFKQINDSFGHQIGDEVLKHTASVIRGRLRETDIFARYGGEEFIIHLPHTMKSDALVLAEELRTLVESQIYRTDRGEVNITISIGVISSEGRGHNGESPKEWLADLLKEVDQALYEAKHTGRNRIVFA
ncbi:histidine kinase N-terminal 7TM domain-containing diguanylate cyclase [Paenibacillus thermotolerans]|uniref:histidine kinase N-terminal 7TM domain-containing diguanylate cyclase n=1 Tax=Paenibacillus thermotolerans TaxID=3027807 RepID=UPI002368F1EC|nr:MULTISPECIES: diguanylate cyclase [unclassified Paenibacillus]